VRFPFPLPCIECGEGGRWHPPIAPAKLVGAREQPPLEPQPHGGGVPPEPCGHLDGGEIGRLYRERGTVPRPVEELEEPRAGDRDRRAFRECHSERVEPCAGLWRHASASSPNMGSVAP
jgi:hypothetical protein